MDIEHALQHSMVRSARRWLLVAVLVLVAVYSGKFAGREAEQVEATLGFHADYNLIVHESSFLVMVLTLALANQSLCLMWITLAPAMALRWRLALICASAAGSVPELYFPMAAYSYRTGLLSSEFPFWKLNQLAEIMAAPGRLTAYSLFGVSFCRWCDGLVDAPTICGLYDVTAIHTSNSAAYVLATTVAWKIASSSRVRR